MASTTDSGSCSPRLSLSTSDSISDIGTPETERSTLFSGSLSNFLYPDQQFIAVVGGLGYIGSHTCFELLKAGENIIIIDNLSNSFRGVYDRLELLSKLHYEGHEIDAPIMRFYEADFRDETAIKSILSEYSQPNRRFATTDDDSVITSRIKGVIHFGAYKSVSESIRNPLKYYANNVAGVIELCATLRDYNIKNFIFSSSATVYGSLANSGVPLKEEYCTHQTENFVDHDGLIKTTFGGCTGLTNPYGRSKWMCEAILSDLALADPEWTIIALRYFNPVGCDESGLLGEDPRGVPTNLMPVVLNVLAGTLPVLDIFGTNYPTPDGTAIRDFIHVTDLARGHIAALAATFNERVPKGFRAYNLGSGTGSSVLDVVTAVEAVSSTKIPIRAVDRRDGDVGICVAMPKRAEVELDWKTQKSLETSCRDIYNFLENKKGGPVPIG
ncbi:UDP-glucose 4-epimerase [Lachnellula hyalina]|uniref:UDP-glucose 4-epimerase n=1 Tax=Lachnellula hyalina TaxID=1316788 RepID=A0A8H8R7J6_9HELO|nr:UDP-glucose 4-epimerase [Lachnellula hyalina]TVY29061.1 UDP-glucose 4-epimerase [Lachnellula hyalina]